jgi:hypothetical protein
LAAAILATISGSIRRPELAALILAFTSGRFRAARMRSACSGVLFLPRRRSFRLAMMVGSELIFCIRACRFGLVF